ncbi:hypothetical protein WJX74_006512 [Apatococcus lobatus]|uniref:tRNA/rRNA methyltransferase SpoU type domain-containing protein n=2 Tax=Apatococcus TaxID=904362 RepID=A0AAW1SE47_9CHLO
MVMLCCKGLECHRRRQQDLHVVLVHPQIPQNAGSIARTCAATGVPLHLVKPLGFEISSRLLKRAGLDYWPYVCVAIHESWQDFVRHVESQPGKQKLIGFSKRGSIHHATPGLYQSSSWLLYGAETDGLPPEAFEMCDQPSHAMARIPILETYVRSLNLAVSTGIGVYEALRQLDGPVLPPISGQAPATQQ